MQKTGKVLLFFIVFSILFGCQNSKEDTKSKLPDNFQISGQILGAANQSIYLEVVNSKGRVKLAETSTEVDGSFSLKGNVKELGLYQLSIGNKANKSVPLTISPKDHVKVKANYVDFERLPNITGTS